MRLNTIQRAPGAKRPRQRVGRGMGSGLGKTCGKGHKGQHARAGGLRKMGFEGGQMPLQRRLPKVGFTSHVAPTIAEVRLHELELVDAKVIDLAALKESNLVPMQVERAKVIASGSLTTAVTLRGIAVTKGARAAIQAAGGKIED